MKTDFSQMPSNLSVNAKKATDDELREKGTPNYFASLKPGDIIEFPKVRSNWHEQRNGFEVYVGVCGYNGKVIALPIGIFRRAPIDSEEFYKKAPLNKKIVELGNFLEIAEFLKGKTLRVASIEEGSKAVYGKYDADGRQLTVIARYPVFELAK